MSKVRFLPALLTLCFALSTPTVAKTIIQCKSTSSPPIIITLGAYKALGHTLNCIRSDLFVDLTPCAPEGKFGLSAPTGTVDLVGIADRWQDYLDHYGGVTGNWISDSQIYFDVGFVSNGSFGEQWQFLVNRLDGTATLSDGENNAKAEYQCSKARAKF